MAIKGQKVSAATKAKISASQKARYAAMMPKPIQWDEDQRQAFDRAETLRCSAAQELAFRNKILEAVERYNQRKTIWQKVKAWFKGETR